MSYLGKISAIVSANTADFSSKLAASSKEVASWARSLNSAVNSASSKASSSLRGIYTEAQKAERALQAIQARKIDFKGFEGPNLSAAVSRMQALISATKGVNGPLNQAARSLERLPVAMQGGFIEAMKRAQTQAERLAFEIDKIGDGKLISGSALEQKFEAIARRAQMTAEAVGRLKEAAGAVGGLATGRELQFRNPEFAAEMARARSIQGQAAATRGGNFAGIIERQRAAADATAEAFARMEEAQLAIGGDVAGTTAEYQRQLAVLKSVGNELERAVTASAGAAAPLIARARAEQDFYETSRRLQQQAAADEAALLIARARAQQDFYETSERLQQQAATDEAAPLIARARAEQDFYETSRRLQQQAGADAQAAVMEGRTSNVAAGQASERQRRAREMLGMTPQSATEVPRELDAVGGRINALRSQLDALPAPMRQIMLPTLTAIQNEFVSLSGAVSPAADQVRRLADLIGIAEAGSGRMAAALRTLRGFGGEGTAGITVGLDQAAVSRAESQLNALQAELSLVSAQARGPGVAAFNDWRNAVANAMAEGTIMTDRVQGELADLRTRAVEAVAALRGVDAGRLGASVLQAGVRRQGDIGRMGVGNGSLALQQAGFAIDDFMSSTGGVDQKLRAISNNLSQMAFILGGTRGLFIGLGVTMAAQAAIMVTKWVNGGRQAEDQTKALNDALARQKSLIQELAQAFRTFGDSLSRGIFSKAGEGLRSFQEDAKEVMKKRREMSENRVVDSDIAVNRERATQAMLERKMGQETVLGRMVALQQRLRESKAREKAAADAAKAAPAPTGGDVAGVLRRSAAAQVQTGEFSFGRPDEAIRARAAELMAGEINAGTSQEELLRMLRLQLSSVAEAQSDYASLGFTNTPLDQAKQELEQAIAQLENALRAKGDPMVQAILDSGIAVNRSLSAVQELIDETVAPFSQTRAEAEKVGDRIREITDELEKGTTPERNAELQKEMEALKQQSAQYRSAAEVIRTFADTVKRISTDLANQVAGEARSTADKDRRNANEARREADMGAFDWLFGDPRNTGPNGQRNWQQSDASAWATMMEARRQSAEEEARRSEDEANSVREQNDRARRQFEAGVSNDPEVQAERKRLEELQGIIDSKDPAVTQEQKAKAAAEKAEIERTQNRRFEDSPEGRAAAARADMADQNNAEYRKRRRRGDEMIESAMRGRELGKTPAELAAEEARMGMLDIGEAKKFGFFDQAEADKRANQFARDQMRSAAPAIFEMADQVQNAILQGPSRQALEVSDVSTMEGSRELNRLLRGDDSSKNQNLVELQKQNQKMGELVTVMRDVAQQMGIVLDLR